MATSSTAALYTPDLLALTIELAEHPLDPHAAARGSARSRSCGSVIEMSSADADRIDSVGMQVSACAVGQASAAIFVREANGMERPALEEMVDALSQWLEGDAPSSILPRLELLEPARPHRGRHEAILLPWRAALDVLSKAQAAR